MSSITQFPLQVHLVISVSFSLTVFEDCTNEIESLVLVGVVSAQIKEKEPAR